MRIVLIYLIATLASTASETIIHCGRLIDGFSSTARKEVTIVIEDDQITAVESGFLEPNGRPLIDLSQATVLPGLIDMHVHLGFELSPQSYTERFFLSDAERAYRSVEFARRTLMAGFTTVRNLGDQGNLTIALRKSIERGWLIGPRIYSAGKSIATTGGHADPTNGLRHDLMGDPGPVEGVVNSAEDGRKAVRQRYKEGADLIKVTATGGVLSMAKSGMNPQFSGPELDAIIATAHDYGFKVAAHAHGAEGMKRAVLAGVDSIEHGTYMTDEVMSLMKERGTWLVPTILAGATVADRAEIDGYFPEVVRPKAATIGPIMQDTFARAYRAGVPIAFGTDSGVSRHGENWREFTLMVEAGMPAMVALQCATSKAAQLLGVDDLGSVKAGCKADLIAVPKDPLTDISIMKEVSFIMKGGQIFKVAD